MSSVAPTLTASAFAAPRPAAAQRDGLAFSAARFLLVATLVAAPLAFGAVEEWAWAALALLAVAIVWLWAIGNARRGVLRLISSPLHLPLALFYCLALIQFFAHLSPDPTALRESLLKLTTDLIFFFLAGQLFASGSDRASPGWGRRLGLTVVIFAFLLSLFAIVQFFSSHGLIYWSVKPRWPGSIFGPYVNRNHYAGLMEMLIPLAVCFVLFEPQGWARRALCAFAVLVPIASVALTGSRGGLLSLLAEALVMAFVLFRRAGAARRDLAAPALAGALGAVALFFWMDPGDASQRFAALFHPDNSPEVTLGDRRFISRDALRIFRDHLGTGMGLGSFESVFPAYQSFPSDLTWEHAHNDYAEALAETGLVGGLLMLWALAAFFRLAFKDLKLRDGTSWPQLGAALGCCGILIHSFFDFNSHIPANAAWFAVCAAWATLAPATSGAGSRAGEEKRRFNPAD